MPAATLIAHLTDIHFGAIDAAATEALSAELRLLAPDLVVISGDLTMGARRAEFRAARAFMDGLGAPTLAVPGNHDITPYHPFERFLAPYARWHDEIAATTEPTWQDGRVAILGLNTARRMSTQIDWSRGRVTRRRLARLMARLEVFPEHLTRIVVAHHPLLPPPGETSRQIAGNAARALAAFAEARVRLVLAGHLHRSYARVAAPEIGAPLILQGGSATSIRLRHGEPNAYNLVRVDGAGAIDIEGRIWTGTEWTKAESQPVRVEEHLSSAPP